MSLAMTVVMRLELSLKYFKPVFKDFKVFYGWPGGWVGGLSETGNKAISASIDIEFELS